MELVEYLKLPNHSQTKLAEEMNVSQGLVYQWLQWLAYQKLARQLGSTKALKQWGNKKRRMTKISPERAKEIEKATKGMVTLHELRPDIFEKNDRAA